MDSVETILNKIQDNINEKFELERIKMKLDQNLKFTCTISYGYDFVDISGDFETIRFPGHNVPPKAIEAEICILRRQYYENLNT